MYEAEKFVANERFFHRSCATCKSCAHKIDSTNLSCGPDGEIYCEVRFLYTIFLWCEINHLLGNSDF